MSTPSSPDRHPTDPDDPTGPAIPTGPEDGTEPSGTGEKPVIAWDAAVSGALFVALIVEQVKLVQRITPPTDYWLQQPYTVASGFLVFFAAALTLVRIKLRRLSYWIMLISLAAVPLAVVLFTALYLLGKYNPPPE
ncbi:hypothetical protein [Spelaeicoccus albus]|uniref:Uncharacterized protein n=1 Tax=Spelaeicoccus albus TaxID=1280376 RepID=A0A7Z0IHL6_9MICO|nr:hypothetical protein [Spelaeicoccus albus]NYI67701.1 hypothetical protein [Spelaeicoccus albus]